MNKEVVVNVYDKYFLFKSVNECARFLNKDYHTIAKWIKTNDKAVFGISFKDIIHKNITFSDKRLLLAQ